MLGRVLRRSQAYQTWQLFSGRARPEPGAIELTQRRVYILPTRHGFTFALAMLLMLVGSINYSLSLGFILTFLLSGMAVVSILHTFRNLAHLKVSAGRVAPVFAGEEVRFALHLDNPSGYARWGVAGQLGSASDECDVPARAAATLVLAVRTAARGWLPLGRVTLETRYPLGLTRAWSYVQPRTSALVYPRPDNTPLPALSAIPDIGEAVAAGTGTDDFAGLRPYQPSDSPRHIAWKSVARDNVLLTKVFTGRAAHELWLDWGELPAALDTEQRLSRLTAWVLAAEFAGLAYGLRLPGVAREPTRGEAHRDACLKALALYGSDPA